MKNLIIFLFIALWTILWCLIGAGIASTQDKPVRRINTVTYDTTAKVPGARQAIKWLLKKKDTLKHANYK